MAMTRQFYSISALATELGRDRRTIASALDAVPADGQIKGGHRGWYLRTALRALGDEPKLASDPMSGPLGCYLDRLENWRETTGAQRLAWPIEDVAATVGKPVETVAIWLRAGCPYVEAGDFETGKGFVLEPATVIDWFVSTSTLAKLCGDKASAAKLHLN